ncbi:MAG TPA: choice-of-anchor Q domain-containing protein [Chthoniobacteraceae bacterium]|jgi:hypothetical protein|nr:choice-of-anchor Q domain-containing protein [Chthoniobacteraceae bacterium]
MPSALLSSTFRPGRLAAVLTLCALGLAAAAAAPPAPSRVTVAGRQFMLERRNADGTLGAPAAFIIRGVNWSPAGPDTATSPADPNNAAVRRQEFAKWYQQDLPLIQAMNANTVRVPLDFGFDATSGPVGRAILDDCYQRGLFVLMMVDDAINDTARIRQAVTFYRDHPAILGFCLGNEININLYYGAASSVADAVQRTEAAAQLIKSLDANHPVIASWGDIDINDNGRRLSDTARYVNTGAPSVDCWGANIFRGRTFGTLFTQWASITAKPLVLLEFGIDSWKTTAHTNPDAGGAPNEAEQRDWDTALWDDLFPNLSARDPQKVAVGGCAFEFNDEHWKIAPSTSQQSGGYDSGGFPDGMANEEFFGVVNIARQPKAAYYGLQAVFAPAYVPTGHRTLTVISLADAGPGSLRQALLDAAAGDRIEFAVTGTITLPGAELVIDKAVTIAGPGAGLLSIERSSAADTPEFRIFNVTAGPVSISGIRIANGRTPYSQESADMWGAGIRNADNHELTLTGCVLAGNETYAYGGAQGGGVFNRGALIVKDTAFLDNKSGGNGGAIWNAGTAELTVNGCTFSGNFGGYFGGAIYVGKGSATIARSSFTNNRVTRSAGGAVWGEYDPMTITACTFDRNAAPTGGAVALKGNVSTISRCTFDANSATSAGGAIANGAVYGEASDMTVEHCTITRGSAASGGGIANTGTGPLRLLNTIVAGNAATGAGPDLAGEAMSQDFNLVGDTAGATFTAQAHDLTGVDPKLAPLADNGGPTFTCALLDGSPAIDAGSSAGSTTDQRDVQRPVDVAGVANAADGADIGAFELVPAGFPTVTIEAGDPTATELGRTTGTITVRRTGATDTALTVRLSLGGSAKNGVDYDALPASVTIQAGASSADLIVRPIADVADEGDETVVAILLPDPAYLVGAPARATVTIADAGPDLTVRGAIPVPVAGHNFTWTLTVANPGATPADGVRLELAFPVNAAFVSSSPAGTAGPGTLSLSLGTLAAHGTRTVRVVLRAPAALGAIAFTAAVAGHAGDPDLSNNTLNLATIVRPASSAVYRGFVNPAGPFAESGFFRLALTSGSAWSAQVIYGGKSAGFVGVLAPDGTFTKTVTVPGLGAVTLRLLGFDENSASGTLTVAGQARAFAGRRQAVFLKATGYAPQAGRYTALLEPMNPPAGAPRGSGFATVVVGTTGGVAVAGQLADGTPFTCASALGTDGTFPFFALLYQGKGRVAGALTPGEMPASVLGWSRPADGKGLFGAGFGADVAFTAARYTAPGANGYVLPGLPATGGKASLQFTGENPAGDLALNLQIAATGKITVVSAGAPPFAMALVRTTGLFAGSVVLPGGGTTTFKGAVLQPDARGGGFFLNPTAAGTVSLAPRP